VIRNRVKRRLKEIFRKELPGLAPGLWIVVTAKPSAANASTEALYAEWLRLAKRLSIFTAP
jgi:ribonuclease P protein component